MKITTEATLCKDKATNMIFLKLKEWVLYMEEFTGHHHLSFTYRSSCDPLPWREPGRCNCWWSRADHDTSHAIEDGAHMAQQSEHRVGQVRHHQGEASQCGPSSYHQTRQQHWHSRNIIYFNLKLEKYLVLSNCVYKPLKNHYNLIMWVVFYKMQYKCRLL